MVDWKIIAVGTAPSSMGSKKEGMNLESLLDFERTLKDTIYNEMEVRTEVVLERAHRVGRTIIGMFLS